MHVFPRANFEEEQERQVNELLQVEQDESRVAQAIQRIIMIISLDKLFLQTQRAPLL